MFRTRGPSSRDGTVSWLHVWVKVQERAQISSGPGVFCIHPLFVLSANSVQVRCLMQSGQPTYRQALSLQSVSLVKVSSSGSASSTQFRLWA